MPALLAKLGNRKSLGIYFDARHVHAVHVVSGLAGARETERLCLPFVNAEQSFEQVFQHLGSRVAGAAVVLGVPTDRCYFATRPISLSSEASAKVLLRESLRSSNTSVDRMTADAVRSRPDKRDVVGIAACEQSYVSACCEPLAKQNVRLDSVEPAPCALLRAAERRDHESRKDALVVRVFVGETELLVVLAAGSQPIVWRTAALTAGDEAQIILALVRSLITVSKPCGIARDPEAVVVHGRPDLERLVDVDWLRQRLKVAFRWAPAPAYTGGDIAYGLALRGLDDRSAGYNLAPQHARERTLWDIFPKSQALACVAAVLLMAGVMWRRSQEVEAAAVAADRAAAHLTESAQSLADLQREKTDLEGRVTAVKKFLETRVLWTSHWRQIAADLPPNIYLTGLDGSAELQTKSGAAGGKRSLAIRGAVALGTHGLVPHEVDRLLDAIRRNPKLAADFPVIELADLKQFRQTGEDLDLALFTIVCLPKPVKKSPAKDSEPKDSHGA